MKKLSDNILCWCKNPEEGAIEQAINISKHPCLIGNVCLMPDTHQGYGMPIGGVVALKDAICPNMVGVDIGCGMHAVKTDLENISIEQLKDILSGIRKNIPLGFEHRKEKMFNSIFEKSEWQETIICKQEYENAQYQLGTLGGGNHFIEIQKGDDGYIWFMIHSGSRNLGKKVADYYNKLAEKDCLLYKQDEVVKNELAFLPKGTENFDNYLKEMTLCLNFAYMNRCVMSEFIKNIFQDVLFNKVSFNREIDIHHNYATIENHYGSNVYVHRKGATLARENVTGIIPGSQGTCSYIVKGKENEASLCSCSHGAGRKMSRKKAQETLDLAKEQEMLNNKGILHSLRNKTALDEAPSAYKDIDTVMEEQKDLVEIQVKLSPLAVVKG